MKLTRQIVPTVTWTENFIDQNSNYRRIGFSVQRTSRCTSALSSKADTKRQQSNVCFVPIADITRTSLARISLLGRFTFSPWGFIVFIDRFSPPGVLNVMRRGRDRA
jgi:hypothetical protein